LVAIFTAAPLVSSIFTCCLLLTMLAPPAGSCTTATAGLAKNCNEMTKLTNRELFRLQIRAQGLREHFRRIRNLQTLVLKPSLATGEDNMTSVEAMEVVRGRLTLKY
jgi:hypothetical protein